MGNLESMPADLGHKAGDTLEWGPNHYRAQSYTITHFYIDILELKISLCLWTGGETEYPEETSEALGTIPQP